MELVLLCGIQAAGKSTFARERFFDTHVRLNMDMLRTRHREQLLLDALIHSKTKLVVDNTNATVAHRARYVVPATRADYRCVCYHFVTPPQDAAARNELREPGRRVPRSGLFGTLKRFEPPTHAEGFDEVYRVVATAGRFDVTRVEPPETAPPSSSAQQQEGLS